jgi:hypothetical protein
VLISETKVLPDDYYIVPEYGNLGKNQQASLVCRYFDGRKLRVEVFWYSSNNLFGRDSCPFIQKPDRS